MLTVATGKLSEAESDRAGLVTTHAYAVLNLVEIKVLYYAYTYMFVYISLSVLSLDFARGTLVSIEQQ